MNLIKIGQIDGLINYITNAITSHIPTTRTFTAGNGLTGGGDLSTNRTFTLGTGSSITKTSTNSVSSTSHTHELGDDVKSDIALGVLANSWGNHASAGYLTSVPLATSTVAGRVELFSDTVQTVAANAVTTTASRTYGVQLNSDGQMVVNVPWVDTNSNTTYTAGTGLTLTGTAFSVNYGTAAGTAAQGNDSRIVNGQTSYDWGRGLRVNGNGEAVHSYLTGSTTDANSIRNASMYVSNTLNRPNNTNASIVNFTPYASSGNYYGFDFGVLGGVSNRIFFRSENSAVKASWVELYHTGNLDFTSSHDSSFNYSATNAPSYTTTSKYFGRSLVNLPYTSGVGSGEITLWQSLMASGSPLTDDPEFETGLNNITKYNNSAGLLERITDDQNSDNSSGFILRITNVASGNSGILQLVNAASNRQTIQILKAKIPVGYRLQQYNNAIGTSGKFSWLTSTAGTGKWEWYVLQVSCGEVGTFSNYGHLGITVTTGADISTEAPLVWYVAYSNHFYLGKGVYTSQKTLKLANSRTINGVAFDGTSNITITDDTKIPTTHVANSITTTDISNWNTAFSWGDYRQFGLGIKADHNSDTNSSRLWDNGFYTLGTNAINRPSYIGANYASGILTISETSARRVQIATGGDKTNRLAFRSLTNTTQTDWNELYHTGNLTNLNQLTNGPGYITASNIANLVPYTGASSDLNLGTLSITSTNLFVKDYFGSSATATNGKYNIQTSGNKWIIIKLKSKIYSTNVRSNIKLTVRENTTILIPGIIDISFRFGSDIRALVSDSLFNEIIYYEDDLNGYISIKLRNTWAYVDIEILNAVVFFDSFILSNATPDLTDKVNVVNAPIDVYAFKSDIVTYTSSLGIAKSGNDFRPTYGTIANTIAQGNDSRILNGQTAFGWGDFRDFGLGRTTVDITDVANIGLNARIYRMLSTATGNDLGHMAFMNLPFQGGQTIMLGVSTTKLTVASINSSSVVTKHFDVWHSGNLTNVSQLTNDASYLTTATLPNPSLITSTTSTGTSNVVTTNSNTYLNIVFNGGSIGSSSQITGAGSVTVASDVNGKITITGTNTTYTGSNGISLAGTVFSPTYGTAANTIAQGNDSRINNGQTAFGWGNHAGLYSLVNHTHDNYYPKTTTNLNGADVNTLTADGIYHGYNWVNGAVAGASLGSIQVLHYSPDWISQIQYMPNPTGTTMYKRSRYSGTTWSPWVEIKATDTTYTTGTLALLNTGTNTSDSVYSPKVISDYVTGKISDFVTLSTEQTITGVKILGSAFIQSKIPSSYRKLSNLAANYLGSSHPSDSNIVVCLGSTMSGVMWEASINLVTYFSGSAVNNRFSTVSKLKVTGYNVSGGTAMNNKSVSVEGDVSYIESVSFYRDSSNLIYIIIKPNVAIPYCKVILDELKLHHTITNAIATAIINNCSVTTTTDLSSYTLVETVLLANFETPLTNLNSNVTGWNNTVTLVDSAVKYNVLNTTPHNTADVITNTDFNLLPKGNYTVVLGDTGNTNVPTGIGTLRGLFKFGSNHVNLSNDIVVGVNGLAFRNSTNNLWRRVWTDTDFDINNYSLSSHTHTFASLTSKPTTLSGYGITDAGISGVVASTATGTSDTTSTTNGNTFINRMQGGVIKETVRLVGAGGTTITHAVGGVITITSANTNTTYTAGTGLTLSGTTFSLPVTDSGSGNYVTNVVAGANGLTVTKSNLPVPSLITSTSSTGLTNVATTNTNTYLNIVENGASVGSSTQITGAGSVTVSSDTDGKLTITGTAGVSTRIKGGDAGVFTSGDVTLTPGVNINIVQNGSNITISTPLTPYYAGTGITLTDSTFSLPITVSGSGNYISNIVTNTNGLTVTKATLPVPSLVTSTTATGTTNANTTNTNTFLNIVENGASVGSSTQVTGAGSVTVSSDINGKLTITGTNTTYSQMTSSVLGLGKIFSDTVQTVAANAVSTTASRTYGVQLNNSGQMVVNVPWTDTNTNTTYTAGTGLTLTGSAFSVNYGTAAGTAAQGNDSRIVNGQTAFGWGNFRDYGLGRTTLVGSNLDSAISNGFNTFGLTADANSPYNYGSVITLNGSSTKTSQLIMPYSSSSNSRYLAYRGKDGSTWDNWVKVWDTNNLTNVSQLTNDVGYTTSEYVDNSFVPYIGATKDFNLADKRTFQYGALVSIDDINKTRLATGVLSTSLGMTGTAQTGILSFKFPKINNQPTMFDITIKIYGYNMRYFGEYRISFYKYSDGLIHASSGAKSLVKGTSNLPSDVVNIHTDADNIYINLGSLTTTWGSYVSISVDRMMVKYSGFNQDYDKFWTISLLTTLPTYTSTTNIVSEVVANKDWTTSNFASSAIQIIAGNGLSGGGTLSANRTLTLGTGTAITKTSTNSVTTTSHTHELGNDVKSDIALGVTANAWGNHASAGYLTSVPLATSTTPGLVELFSDTVQTVAANAVTTTTSRTYGIQLNSAGQMVVNVPWVDTNTNTTYTAGNGLTLSGTAFSLPVTDSGSGNYVTNVVASANGLTVTKATLPVPSLVTSTTATGTTNATTTNTNTFLNIVENGASVGSSTQVTGAGSVTVSSDTAGKLTITGSNTTYTAGSGLLLTGTVFSVNYGTAAGTSAQGNDSRIVNGQTAFGWGDHSSAGYVTASHTHTFASLTSKPTTLGGYGITDAGISGVVSNSATGTTDVASSTNGNTYINRLQGGVIKETVRLVGAGGTTITHATGGVITITSVNTNTTYTAGNGLTLTGTTFSINQAVLDNIEKGVFAYTWGNHASAGYLTSVPAATATTNGIRRLYSNTVQSVVSNAVSATAGRTYGVQVNSSGQMVVNVPWVEGSGTPTTLRTLYSSTISGDILFQTIGNISITTSGNTMTFISNTPTINIVDISHHSITDNFNGLYDSKSSEYIHNYDKDTYIGEIEVAVMSSSGYWDNPSNNYVEFYGEWGVRTSTTKEFITQGTIVLESDYTPLISNGEYYVIGRQSTSTLLSIDIVSFSTLKSAQILASTNANRMLVLFGKLSFDDSNGKCFMRVNPQLF